MNERTKSISWSEGKIFARGDANTVFSQTDIIRATHLVFSLAFRLRTDLFASEN